MNATEAALMAREHFYEVPGMLPDLGFETSRIHRVDDDWVVEGRVFSMFISKMMKYWAIISDDEVQSIEWG